MQIKWLAAALALAAVTATQPAPPPAAPPIAGWWRLVTTSPPPNTPSQLIVEGPSRFSDFHLYNSFPTGVVLEILSLDPARAGTGIEAKQVGNALVLTRSGRAQRGAGPAMPERQEAWSVDAAGRLHIEVTDRWPGGTPVRAETVYERMVPATRRGVNLLENSDGGAGGAAWWSTGGAKVEDCNGNPCFVVRSRGAFHQKVQLPAGAEGQYLVAIGSGANERVGASITDKGRLYGQFATADGFLFLGVLQGQAMRAESAEPNGWVKMSGIFPVPANAAQVTFELGLAEARDVPPNGSAARFDDLGLFGFATDSEARAVVERWSGRRQ